MLTCDPYTTWPTCFLTAGLKQSARRSGVPGCLPLAEARRCQCQRSFAKKMGSTASSALPGAPGKVTDEDKEDMVGILLYIYIYLEILFQFDYNL